MTNAVKRIPDDYRHANPFIIVHDAAGAIEFYKNAFGAREHMRFDMPDGKVAHAEFRIGDSIIMIGDEMPDYGFRGPISLGGTPSGIYMYVEDVDAVAARAAAAGATILEPPEDKFYGSRAASLKDPYGHNWHIATQIEEISHEEMQRRHEAFLASMAAAV